MQRGHSVNLPTLLTPEFIKKINFFYSCGNHGDPIFCDDLLHIYEWMKDKNPATNTHHDKWWVRDEKWWEKLTSTVR